MYTHLDRALRHWDSPEAKAELAALREVAKAARNHWNECEDSDLEKALAALDRLREEKEGK